VVAEISVTALAMVDADPGRVRDAIADYRKFRPAILTPRFSGYEVLEGGRGAGSRVRWTLNPGRWTRRRARVWEVSAEEKDGMLIEHDALSPTVLTWTVVPAPDGRSAVKLTLTFTAPGGLGGLRARSRGNKLHHLYGEMLLQLRRQFTPPEGQASGEGDDEGGGGEAGGEGGEEAGGDGPG
jgi:hypothetical protein